MFVASTKQVLYYYDKVLNTELYIPLYLFELMRQFTVQDRQSKWTEENWISSTSPSIKQSIKQFRDFHKNTLNLLLPLFRPFNNISINNISSSTIIYIYIYLCMYIKRFNFLNATKQQRAIFNMNILTSVQYMQLYKLEFSKLSKREIT